MSQQYTFNTLPFKKRALQCGLGVLGIFIALPTVQAEVLDRIIVKYKPVHSMRGDVSAASVQRSAVARLEAATGQSVRHVRHMLNGAQVIEVAGAAAVAPAVALLAADPAVEYAEPDRWMVPAAVDPLLGDLWNISGRASVRAQGAWAYGTGAGVTVAVLDSGVTNHKDVRANLLPGYDFITNPDTGADGDGRDSDASDPGTGVLAGGCGGGQPAADFPSDWHGTHIASIIAGVGDNGEGVKGVAPDAKILPVRVLGRCGGLSSDIADAIQWAAGVSVNGVPSNANPAAVINLSLTSDNTGSCGMAYRDAIASARNRGAIVVAAAGNMAANANDYSPGNCPGVVTVAASTISRGVAYYSNLGSVVDFVAPGGELFFGDDSEAILSAGNSGAMGVGADNYSGVDGTSMAAPHVSGALAVLKGIKPAATENELLTLLRNNAVTLDTACNGCGAGLVDLNASARKLFESLPVEPDPVEPDPVEPDPVEPDPVEPDPVEPDPVEPDPVEPDPVEPDPVEPDPVEPDPVEPDPVEPVVVDPVVVPSPVAELAVDLLGTPGTFSRNIGATGGYISFQVQVKNSGEAVAEAVVVALGLPGDVELVALEASVDANCQLGAKRCTLTALGSGEVATINVTVSAEKEKERDFSVTVTTDTEEGTTDNNAASDNYGGAWSLSGLLLLSLLASIRRYWRWK